MSLLKVFSCMVLLISPRAYAENELDRQEVFPQTREEMKAQASPQQRERAKALPQTVILRINEKDPSKMEVAFLRDKVSAEKVKTVKADFQKLAENSELRGIPYETSNELDATSSTSSWWWRRGWGGWGGWGGWRPGWGGGWGGGGWWRPPVWNTGWWGGGGGWGGGCPSMFYGGFNFPYCPFAGWNSGGFVNVAFSW